MKVSQAVFLCAMVAFLAIVAAGIYLVVGPGIESIPNSSTDFSADAGPEHLRFEIKTGVPGVALIFLGALGLVALIYRVPITSPVRLEHSEDDTLSSDGHVSAGVVSRSTRVPYLYWLLYYKHRGSARSTSNPQPGAGPS